MVVLDALTAMVFLATVLLGIKAKHVFDKSKQALSESASIISLIVDSLSSRLDQSESLVNQLQAEVGGLKTSSAGLEWEQATLRSSHLQLLQDLHEILTNDRRLIAELEQIKSKFSAFQNTGKATRIMPNRKVVGVVGGDIFASLTPTERGTLQIIRLEGPKAAPELGRRLNKSREHTSRLMKKLYLEGYVDRESNRAPFRYDLSETARSAFGPDEGSVRAEASETA